ncbi:type IV secretory system conjugative DNA transfer family protein [Nocardia altamirensis]|uniref:type IV secretory system conjugative DNA transfer family protein n=1 Tax=Nocardia altamirensis TaxID=472158 RepID=UPI0008407682|nr:FtsK/SpoIIIE domain-containing protein [Nocardia altamirensis]
MTGSATRTDPTAMPVELLVPAGGLVFGFLAWQALHQPFSEWALRNHLFSTDPIIEFPGAGLAHTGPTFAGLVAAAALLLALVCAVGTIMRVIGWWHARFDPSATDRDRRLPRFTAAATVACTTDSAATVVLTALTAGVIHQYLVLVAAAVAATAVTSMAVVLVRPRVERIELLDELAHALYPYLGYTKLPNHRFLTARGWDTNTPHKLTLSFNGRLERLPKVLGEHLNAILEGNYVLTTDRKARRIHATLATEGDATPTSIARLRDKISQSTMFEAGATVTDIQPTGTPDFTSFVVRHNISHKLAGSVRTQLIERKISEILPGRWRASWDHETDSVRFSRRPEFPEQLAPLLPKSPPKSAAEAIARYDETVFVFADTEDAEDVVWDPKRFPHALCIGTSGSGKTATTHTMITQAAQHQWPIFIFDFKGTEFNAYREWPNVQMVITEVEEAITVIEHLYQIMMRRYDKGKVDPSAKKNALPFLIVVDEFTELVDRIREFYADNRDPQRRGPAEPPTLTQFYSMARLARTNRMHLFVGLQRPDASIMAGEGRDNFIMRISMGKLSRVAADMVWESIYIGRTVPPGKRGRATARDRGGTPVEVQCHFTPDPDDPSSAAQRIITALRPTVRSYDRLLVVPSSQMADKPGSFDGYRHLEIVRAVDRPDLDPLSPQYFRLAELSAVDPSAPMTPTKSTPAAGHEPALTMVKPPAAAARKLATDPVETWFGALESEPEPTPITRLEPGDCLLYDIEPERWVILEEAPAIDEDTRLACLFVRDPYTGEQEVREISVDDTVYVRAEKPEEVPASPAA